MKKITFILFALIAGTTFAQTEEGTADVNAEIVSPISIAEGTALDFGQIIGAVTGGDVTISNDGATRTIAATLDVPSSGFSSAAFEVTASDLYTYSITIPVTTITDGTTTMDVSFTHDKAASGNVGDGLAQTVNVGGTLTVGNNQPSGLYSGTVTVQVAYE